MEDLYSDVLRDIPSYRKILKVVLKSQIQLLVQQLFEHTGEETVLISANVDSKSLSYLGSDAGKDFITNCDDVKSKFLDFCIHRSTRVNLKSLNEKSSVGFTRKPYNRLPSRFSKLRDKQGFNINTRGHMNENRTFAGSGNRTPVRSGNHSFVGSENQSSSRSTNQTLLGPECVMKSARKVDLVFIQDKTNSKTGTSKKPASIRETELTPEQKAELTAQGVDLTPNTIVVKQEPQDDDDDDDDNGVLNNEQNIDSVVEDDGMSWKPGKNSSNRQTSIGCQSDFDENESTDPLYNTRGSNKKPKTVVHHLYENDCTIVTPFDKSPDESFNWSHETHPTPTGSGASKVPQMDGVFVSRGFGRYEKLIRCDRCSKVCRTSNMARHKKKYCDNILKKRAEKIIQFENVQNDIYIDNPMETSIDSASDLDNSEVKHFTQIKMSDFVAEKENKSDAHDDSMSTIIVKQEPDTF
ncbi:hypothetical protein ACF0H5_024005 [Mactra antiquata]